MDSTDFVQELVNCQPMTTEQAYDAGMATRYDEEVMQRRRHADKPRISGQTHSGVSRPGSTVASSGTSVSLRPRADS